MQITTIGECLIDWVCLDKTTDLYEATEFIKAPGGAPANVAIGIAKLNYPVQFVGGFSKDLFGTWLKEVMSSYNVDLSLSVDIPDSNTRNAYILTDKNGDRVLKCFNMFSCADSMINIENINVDAVIKSPLVYFGSLLQATESSRSTIYSLLNAIKDTSLIIYDPNLRIPLWKNYDEAMNVITDTFHYADIVKLSANELHFITGISDIDTSSKYLFENYNLKLLVVTLGHKGSYYLNKKGANFVRPFKVETVETTGAGDAFVAGVICGIYDLINKENPDILDVKNILDILPSSVLEKIILRANAMGAITTTKPGATAALPSLEELEEFLKSQS